MAETTTQLKALLMERSLTDPGLQAAAADFRILPDATVIKIGGQSVIDRGRAAVYPWWTRSSPPAPRTNCSSVPGPAPALVISTPWRPASGCRPAC